jgi:predicted ABC-type transport system involved in lysophospholipase L1 biosynthesis ATPase subunit
VVVTHDAAIAERAERTLIMRDGNISDEEERRDRRGRRE